jgi:lipid-A-disaccharide synthase
MPEFIQAECTPGRLGEALLPLLRGGAARDAQVRSLQRIDGSMRLSGDDEPSRKAARIVLSAARPAVSGPSST